MMQTQTPPHKYDIHIAQDGRWYHEGGEIKRQGLVKLFASVLSCEAGQFWLRTPAEAGIITVEDAPFLITSCDFSTENAVQTITCEDNLQRQWQIGESHPLKVKPGPGNGEPRPYLYLEKGLYARMTRPVFYELAEKAELDKDGMAGISSNGHWFRLEPETV